MGFRTVQRGAVKDRGPGDPLTAPALAQTIYLEGFAMYSLPESRPPRNRFRILYRLSNGP
jgi:hypothetical protein